MMFMLPLIHPSRVNDMNDNRLVEFPAFHDVKIQLVVATLATVSHQLVATLATVSHQLVIITLISIEW